MEDSDSEMEYDDFNEEPENSQDDLEEEEEETMGAERMLIEETKEKEQEFQYEELSSERINSEKEKLFLSLKMFAFSEFGVDLPRHILKEFLVKSLYNLDLAKTLLRDQIGCVLESMEFPSPPNLSPESPFNCMICWNELPFRLAVGLECGHSFCPDCYRSYIENSMSTDLGNIDSLKCPLDKCKYLISANLQMRLLSPESFEKLSRFTQREFINKSYNLLPCTGENCFQTFLLKFKGDNKATLRQADLWCWTCLGSRCTKCEKEAHLPVPCILFKNWCDKTLGKDDSISSAWIKTNTNPCPKCKKQIEKNQGCMHMTCIGCRHEFCWLCFKDWKGHDNKACSIFREDLNQVNEDQKQLRKFDHYSKRFFEHFKAVKMTREELRKAQENIQDFERNFKMNPKDFGFLVKASETSMRARQAVANSYALSYQIKAVELQEFFDLTLYFLEHQLEHLSKFLENLNLSNWFEIKDNQVGFRSQFSKDRQEIVARTEEVEKKFSNFLKETMGKKFLDRIISQEGIFAKKDEEIGWFCTQCQRLNPSENTVKCYRCELPKLKS